MRDHLANERTLLAWVRTGLALMAFGLGIAKLATFIHLAALDHPELAATLPAPWISKLLGATLVGAGSVTAALGAWRTRRWAREVAGAPPSFDALDLVAGVTAVTGAALVAYVWLG
jgi:putative membrane protein